MDEKGRADMKKSHNLQRRDLVLKSSSLKVEELCKDDMIMLIESEEELQRWEEKLTVGVLDLSGYFL